MDNIFQPVLVSWQTPGFPEQWNEVICKREVELEFFRHELRHVKHYEQRIYSI